MASRIPVLLDEKTTAGLVALAKREYRDPRQQAAILIWDGLTKHGMLPQDQPSEPDPKAEVLAKAIRP